MENKADSGEVTIRLDPSIVDAHVQAAIAKALSESPEALVKAVVETAMKRQTDSYPRRSIFQETVEKMIRSAAETAFQRWLIDNERLLTDAIEARLKGQPTELFQQVAHDLVEAMGKGFRCDVSLKEKTGW